MQRGIRWGILSRYATSTSDCTHASIRLASLLLRDAPFPPTFLPLPPSTFFFRQPTRLYPGYVLFMARQIPVERNRFFLDASGQPARRGNLFDTLYANGFFKFREKRAQPRSDPFFAENNFFDYVTLMRPPSLPLSFVYKSSFQILFVV